MREMKDSGVEWIGKIPENWNIKKLKYILKRPLQYGANESGIEYSDELPRYIRITDIDENGNLKNEGKLSLSIDQSEGFLLENQDILFARSGASVGKTFFYQNKYGRAAFAGYLIRASINKKQLLPHYVYFYTLGAQYELWKNGIFNQATIQNIGADKYSEFKISFPESIEEQKRVVIYLEQKCAQIDSIISKQEAIIEKLKEYKLSVITEAVTKGLNPDVEMKDSGVDLIDKNPCHWKEIKVKKHLIVLTDYDANGSFADIATNVKVNVGIPYAWMVRATDLENCKYGISDFTNYCDEDTYNFLSKSKLEGGDLIVAKRGGIGNVYIVPEIDCKMTLAPNTYLLRFDENLLEKFMYYIFKSKYGQESLRLLNKSTTIGAVYKDDIKNLRITIPNVIEQEDIVNFLDSCCEEIENKISNVEMIIEKLKEYKKSLIYEVVTGKKEI